MIKRAFFLLLSCCALITAVSADDWGCYAPKPGHPTATERMKFIQDVSELAVAAETKYGVPASALAAMAIVESGYGWTRTALEAHNFFGWKFTSSKAAGQRDFYILDCQPREDVNNRYVVFSSAGDAVDFVAAKLATLPAYQGDTKAYKLARSKSADTANAVKSWLAGIADPYNWKPAKYVRDVTRIMNDPISPSDTVSPEHNLYALSEGVTFAIGGEAASQNKVASPTSTIEENTSQEVAQAKAYYIAHLGKRNCDPPDTKFPRWSGYPIQNCVYEDVGITVRTYMLNPSAEQLARWTVTACHDAGAVLPEKCIIYMGKKILNASSGVFPVDGYIPEPGSSVGASDNGARCPLFRDGVTISTESWDTEKPIGNGCGPADESKKAALRAKKYARVASTSRQDYLDAGGTEEVGKDCLPEKQWQKRIKLGEVGTNCDVRWIDVVRELYKQAWKSDRNQLISAKAKAEKARGAFK